MEKQDRDAPKQPTACEDLPDLPTGFHYPVHKSRTDQDWMDAIVESGTQTVMDQIVQAIADGYCSTGACASGRCTARVRTRTYAPVFENDNLLIIHVTFIASCRCT